MFGMRNLMQLAVSIDLILNQTHDTITAIELCVSRTLISVSKLTLLRD